MLIIALLCLAGFSAQAAHTQARLVLASDTAKPGDTVLAGVFLQMDEGWHTYWKNSGDSGMPTTVNWELPGGVSAGEIQWPAPDKLPEPELTTYIYQNEALLLVPLKLSPDLPPGPLELKAKISWLECRVQCLPGKTEVEATLTIGPEAKASKDAPLLAAWDKKLPLPGDAVSARAWWEKPPQGDTAELVLAWNSSKDAQGADFYPETSDGFEVASATERIPGKAGTVSIRKQIKKVGAGWPSRISGLLVQVSDGRRTAYKVNLAVAASADSQPGAQISSASTTATSQGGSTSVPSPSLGQMLLYAFIGGLILNIMPCVLPVIALKILGFVGQSKADPRRARMLGLVYAAGVLVSFLALAGWCWRSKRRGTKPAGASSSAILTF